MPDRLPQPIDLTNHFMVGVRGAYIVSLKLRFSIFPEEALNLAAFLVATADPLGKEFPGALKKVLESRA